MNTNIEESARKAHEALTTPINELFDYLKQKLHGSYNEAEMRGWFGIENINRVYLINEFPGCCFFESKDKQRTFIAKIYFDWSKFQISAQKETNIDRIEFDLTEKNSGPNYFKSIPIKVIKNDLFLKSLTSWLNDGSEILWEKWQ